MTGQAGAVTCELFLSYENKKPRGGLSQGSGCAPRWPLSRIPETPVQLLSLLESWDTCVSI